MAEIKKSINTSNELTDNKYLQDRYQRVNSRTHDLMEAQNSLIDSLNQAIKSLQENSNIMIDKLNENDFEFMMDDYYPHKLRTINAPTISVETEHTDIDSM